MLLSELLVGLGAQRIGGAGDPWVTGVTVDPAEAGPGVLFVARQAWWGDQHKAPQDVIESGCCAVVVSRDGYTDLAVPTFRVASDDPFLGHLCDRFYGAPTKTLNVIGVTGTNGKTSTVVLVEHMLSALGERPASMGTLGYRFEDTVVPATNTTPDAIVIQRFARDVKARGATALVMEVSSHGLDLQRVAGVAFDAVGFTMFGRDHLDHHGDVEAYFAAKARLFTECVVESAKRGKEPVGAAFDDADGRRMLAQFPGWPVRLGDVEVVPLSFGRMQIKYDDALFEAPFFGQHEAKNAVMAAALVAGGDPAVMHAALNTLKHFKGVPGRLQQIAGTSEQQRILIDYAHTPDAIDRAICAIGAVDQLTIVVGCGGDRDPGKRPLMAAASLAADVVILTDDNPRSESSAAILDAMVSGVPISERSRVQRIPDRARAIATAIQRTPRGVVLIVGKGHEQSQTVGDVSRVFDDAVEARRSVQALLAGADPVTSAPSFAARPLAPSVARLPSLS